MKHSVVYFRCQELLLSLEIRCKRRRLPQLFSEYDCIKQKLQYQLSRIDSVHVASLLLVSNDKTIHKNGKIYCRKLQKLIPKIHETSIIHNVSQCPNKVIYNFLDYHLTDSDKSLLIRGLNFAIPPKKIEYSKFLLPFKLLFCGIKSKNEYSVDLAVIKACLRDRAFTFSLSFEKILTLKRSLCKNEFETLCKLKDESNLFIQKADKGNTIIILDKGSNQLKHF